jgi:uncharacterized protein
MEDKNFAIIKKVTQQILPGSSVILFGSRAKGTNRPDSDYDILIIIKDALDPRQKLQMRTLIRNKLRGSGIIADVLMQSQAETQVKKTLPGHIVRIAFEEGYQI